MFRFVYALHADEPADPRWMSDGFVGIEAAEPREALTRIGVRGVPASADMLQYVIHPPAGPDATAPAFGKALADAAERAGDAMLLIESGEAFTTAHALWGLMESAGHPRVKVALDLNAVRAAGQLPAVLIPTINLRIGLVRVSSMHDDLTSYARRLAGIGFEGFVVIDPPAGPERAETAQALAAVFRDIFPKKPAKKVPAGKSA